MRVAIDFVDVDGYLDDGYVEEVYANEATKEAATVDAGGRGIKFPASVPGYIASSLRRLHQNLGHPSTADFVRHLRLAGASQEVLKAARALECQTCRRCKQPAIAKPAKIANCLRFNEVVGVDLFYVHNSEENRHQMLSVVDFSSGYHVVIPVTKKDTNHLEKTFAEAWVGNFGAPSTVCVDLETGLQKALARIGDWTGMRIRSAAGQAHWQAGYTEKQGGIWKAIFNKINDEQSVSKGDIHIAAAAVSSAKNNLARTSGYSPCQHVFGSSPALPEDLLNGYRAGLPGDEPVIDDKHAREVALRTAARAAYHHVQTDERVRRALLGRTRVQTRLPEVGERVFFYRKTRNNKRGLWHGPATVIGKEDNNYWVTKNGRCLLCAPEHLRLATGEELGEMFALRVAREDLDKLLNADQEDEGVYGDQEEGDCDMEEAADYVPDDMMEDLGISFPRDNEAEDAVPAGGAAASAAAGPRKRLRSKGPAPSGPVQQAMMLKRARTPRSREKQLEKELPWNFIPEERRDDFRAAEAKQWGEHINHGALEVLSLQESLAVRDRVRPERILPSRYAYRDKNLGRRRADPSVPWKPKARLVVAGHLDPDLATGTMLTDSPTVSRAGLTSVLQICASYGWKAAAGDIQAAFLNGLHLERELYMAQPRGGVDGLHPGQLVRIWKGVFGLSESPRMWFDRLKEVLMGETFFVNGADHKLSQCPLDPCIFCLLSGSASRPGAYIAIHVDDLLIVAPPETNRYLQDRIGKLLPVDGWEEDEFDYIGSHVTVYDDEIVVCQEAFVEGRLFNVDIAKDQDGGAPASEEQTIDNRSLIGALSWLSGQTRADLQCSVALAQQVQRAPLGSDIRFTNATARKALDHKSEGVRIRAINLGRAVFTVFHDAAWANAEHEEAEDGFRLSNEEIVNGSLGTELFSDDRPRPAKKQRSKIASQIGHAVFLFDRKLFDGETAKGSLLEWRSQACKRVCRSTFGAETMACIEGIEACQYHRALLATLVSGRFVQLEEARKAWPMVAMTDCKSLHDHLHRAGIPRVPTDRRLAIDLASLRQELAAEVWDRRRLPLQWIPTTCQLADPLTKPMQAGDWWKAIREGTQLPLKKGTFSFDKELSFSPPERGRES